MKDLRIYQLTQKCLKGHLYGPLFAIVPYNKIKLALANYTDSALTNSRVNRSHNSFVVIGRNHSSVAFGTILKRFWQLATLILIFMLGQTAIEVL